MSDDFWRWALGNLLGMAVAAYLIWRSERIPTPRRFR